MLKPAVTAKLLEFLEDPDRDSLDQEKALARALYCDYLERTKGGQADENRAWLATIANMADKQSRIEARRALDARQVIALKVSIIGILRDILDDDAAREFQKRFAEAWGLPERASVAALGSPAAGEEWDE